jgi:hypothetical protein
MHRVRGGGLGGPWKVYVLVAEPSELLLSLVPVFFSIAVELYYEGDQRQGVLINESFNIAPFFWLNLQ